MKKTFFFFLLLLSLGGCSTFLYKKEVERYPNGQVKNIIRYKDGILNGPFESFYPGGNKQATLNFKNGQLDGINTIYNTGFIPRMDVIFENGVPVKQIEYSWNGNISRVIDNSSPSFNPELLKTTFLGYLLVLNSLV